VRGDGLDDASGLQLPPDPADVLVGAPGLPGDQVITAGRVLFQLGLDAGPGSWVGVAGHAASMRAALTWAYPERMGLTLSKNERWYPSTCSPAELARARQLVHELSHQGLSIRQVRQRLIDHHVWRSVGSICADLRDYECDQCATTPAPAGPAVRPEVLRWG
jgi:hypothetical protein